MLYRRDPAGGHVISGGTLLGVMLYRRYPAGHVIYRRDPARVVLYRRDPAGYVIYEGDQMNWDKISISTQYIKYEM